MDNEIISICAEKKILGQYMAVDSKDRDGAWFKDSKKLAASIHRKISKSDIEKRLTIKEL